MVNHYTPELGREICEWVAKGFTISKACAANEHFPSDTTVYTWLIRYSEFGELYSEAKVKQMEVWGEQIIDLSDNVPADADAVAKAKLQVHTRQWVMGKLKPKKYGDSTTIKGDKDNPISINLASALDNAIASRAAGKVIDHEPRQNAFQLSQPTVFDNESE